MKEEERTLLLHYRPRKVCRILSSTRTLTFSVRFSLPPLTIFLDSGNNGTSVVVSGPNTWGLNKITLF